MYVSWLGIGLTTKMNSCLFDIIKSSVSRYLVTWTNLLYFSFGSVFIQPNKKSSRQKQYQKFSKINILPLDALQTVPKYFVKHHHHCPSKAVQAQVISPSNAKVCLEQLHLELKALSVSFMHAVMHARKCCNASKKML